MLLSIRLLCVAATLFGVGCAQHQPETSFQLGKFATHYRSDSVFADEPQPLSLGGIKGFIKAGYAEQENGLYLLEPVDARRTPVLFVHGLLSGPSTWKPMVEALRKDRDINERFQFWFYSYPTATPAVPAAAIMKRHLDQAIDTIEQELNMSMNRRLIVVGHSMGGILAKSLVSRTDNVLWDALFLGPPEAFDLSPSQRTLLTSSFRYKPRRYVSEVIFIASPHRGSNLANGFLGWIGKRFSARPKEIDELAKNLITKNKHLLKPEFFEFVSDNVNAVATLRPDSPVTAILADMPTDPKVTRHSIAGLKKKRSIADFKGSDGVVALASTQIQGLCCQVGIFSGHGVHYSEEAKKVVAMLLRHNAGLMKSEDVKRELKGMNLPIAEFNKP